MSNARILVISDVDGCLTTGQFIYTADGKVAKVFGANDHEGIKLLRKNNIDVEFITADKTGLPITMARMKELHCKCTLVSEADRAKYIFDKYKEGYEIIVFFGDGVGDSVVKRKGYCDYFIVPENARQQAKNVANAIMEHSGGNGAFMDLAYWTCNKLLRNFIDLYE